MEYLTGEVGKDITLQVIKEIINSGETELMITTDGGNYFEGLAIRDYLKQTNQIKSIGCLGMVASAGTLIMQGVKDRWATPSSKFLIHGVQGGAHGSAKDVQQLADDLRKLSNEEALNYSLISGKSIEDINKIMDEERILYAEEALSLNLINRITNLNNHMTKKDEQLNWLSTFANKLKSALFTNLNVQSTDGDELELDGVESLAQIVVGTPCKPDGSFVLADGTSIKVEGGLVTEVIAAAPVEDEAMAALKAENEELKAALEVTNQKLTELKNKADMLKTLTAEFDTFKNKFSNHIPDVVAVPEIPKQPESRIKITRK